MNGLLISSAVLLILTWWKSGFNILSILATISTLLFCSRKVGHFCQFKTLAGLEGTGAFLQVMMWLVFKRFHLVKFLLIVAFRLIFLAIALYDIKMFVYVKEVHRKDNSDDNW